MQEFELNPDIYSSMNLLLEPHSKLVTKYMVCSFAFFLQYYYAIRLFGSVFFVFLMLEPFPFLIIKTVIFKKLQLQLFYGFVTILLLCCSYYRRRTRT